MKDSLKSFLYLKLFIIVVILVFIISVGIKLGSEVVNGSFKNNSYSLLYLMPKDAKIITVDKKRQTYAFYSAGNVRDYLKGKSTFEISVFLRVPINAVIVDPQNQNYNKDNFIQFSNEMKLIFAQNDKLYRKLDKYDIYKLITAANNTPKDNRVDGKINIFDDASMLTGFFSSFKDSSIADSTYTVEIVNGTSINGFGTRVANLLSTVGFNVISVRSDGANKQNSFISSQLKERNYLSVLQSLTGFELKNNSLSKVADVTVYLGKELE